MTTAQAHTETVACPFCRSTSAVAVRSAADIVQCVECETVYLRTRLSDAALYALYQNYAHEGSHMRLPGSEEEIAQSELRRTAFVEEALGFVQPGGIWRGIELTRSCVDFATMVLGIPVSNSDFLDSAVQPDSCAVISMVHVLEHLTHPAESLRKVRASLVEGGLFCGIVPNFDSLCSELLQDGWAWLDPYYHYVHYTPTTLRARLSEAGFAVERMYTATGDYGTEIVLNYIRSVAPELPPSVSYEDLLAAVEADGRGEEIRFFARKVSR